MLHTITDGQRKVLGWGAVLILASLMFPPYYVEGVEGGPTFNIPMSHVVVQRSGIGFIFNMPSGGATIHASVLLCELLGATIATAFAFVATQGKERQSPASHPTTGPPPIPRSN